MTMQPSPRVSRAMLESLLERLAPLPGRSEEGLFGPSSVSWRVNRESAVFLGAGRAALLQLAHPWVAASLQEHSNLRNDAIGRFHGTFRVIYTMVFGTRAQAFAAARQLYLRHTRIRGELPETVGEYRRGEHYEANETAALRWVWATLVDSALLAYGCVLPALTAEEREQYYREACRMAALFGLNEDSLPPDWAAFSRYLDDTLHSPVLQVSASARALGSAVLSGVGTWVRPPGWYRALTASWLPPHLCAGFGLAFSARERASLAIAMRVLSYVYRRVPKSLRYVGPFQEAQAQLSGRTPGWLTRSSNRFWTGQPRLFFPLQESASAREERTSS